MSQRLIQPGLAGVTARPRPGDIIGYGKRGPIRLQAGGAPGDDGEDAPPDGAGGDDDSDDDSDDEDEDEDDDADKGKKKKKKDDEEPEEEVVSKRKYDKTHARMTAADRRSSELQAKLDELKDSAKVPDEIKRELAEIKSTVAEQTKTIEKITGARDTALIKLASLTVKGAPEWKNVEAALKLADLTDVEVFDDGKVDTVALKKALKKAAVDHPYLVVDKKTEATDDTKNEQGGAPTMNGKRKGAPTTPDRAALSARFPVLNQR